MTDARSSSTPATRRAGVISGLLLVLPLVLGARDCESPDDGECDDVGARDCQGDPGGESGTGGSGPVGGSNAAGRDGSGGAGGGGCLYAGERHDVGDSFPSDDGCNTCSCTADGMVGCTLRACTNACGGLTGLQCRRGQYCNYPEDAQCGAADQTGTCEERPSVCTDQYDPVCGCDGGGSAGSAGDGSAGSAGDGNAGSGGGGESGAGAGSGQTCGGIASLECADPDEFCNYEPSAGGQGCDGTISDAGGACRERPQICTQEYAPVCGCDRRTYATDCTAHGAGMSVLHDGACTEIDCAEIGGHAVDGFGPAPMCPSGEVDHGSIAYSNGMIAIEGTICCVPQ